MVGDAGLHHPGIRLEARVVLDERWDEMRVVKDAGQVPPFVSDAPADGVDAGFGGRGRPDGSGRSPCLGPARHHHIRVGYDTTVPLMGRQGEMRGWYG